MSLKRNMLKKLNRNKAPKTAHKTIKVLKKMKSSLIMFAKSLKNAQTQKKTTNTLKIKLTLKLTLLKEIPMTQV